MWQNHFVQKHHSSYVAALHSITTVVCLFLIVSIPVSNAADESKMSSKKTFEETKRDLKKASEKVEKGISEGASAAAQKLKKAFSSEKK